jgi:hypothetical protein
VGREKRTSYSTPSRRRIAPSVAGSHPAGLTNETVQRSASTRQCSPAGSPTVRACPHRRPRRTRFDPSDSSRGAGAVAQASRANVVDGLAQPRVGSHAGQGGRRAEVVEPTEHVVVPSIGVEQVEVPLFGRFTRAEPTEQGAASGGTPRRRGAPPATRGAAGDPLVFQESLENVDRGVERRSGRAVLGLASSTHRHPGALPRACRRSGRCRRRSCGASSRSRMTCQRIEGSECSRSRSQSTTVSMSVMCRAYR